jgi:two-component system chemotaxis response regulator CheY
MAKHLLAVDDEANVTRLIQVILGRAGYRVTTAADGLQALERIREERPDAIFLDITMPHLDGIELLRRLKAEPETASIPVALLTAKSQDADVLEGHRSGAQLYLPKPFSPAQIMEAAREMAGPAEG